MKRLNLVGPVYMIRWREADRLTGLQRDLDLLVDFRKVFAVEALEAAWSSLYETMWRSGQIECFAEISRSTC